MSLGSAAALAPGVYVLESSCPSLGTTAFSVFPLIQLQRTGPFKQGSRRWSRWKRKHCACEHWNRLTFKGWAHSFPSPKTWHKPGQPVCVAESQLLAYLPRTCSPIKIVAPKTRVPFFVLSEALPPNFRFKFEAPSPDDWPAAPVTLSPGSPPSLEAERGPLQHKAPASAPQARAASKGIYQTQPREDLPAPFHVTRRPQHIWR